MTEAEKEQRRYALAISGGVCSYCSKQLGYNAQGAHIIGNTKANRQKYGDFVIDHKINVVMVCSLACNAKMDISKNTGDVIRHIAKIYEYELQKYEMED